MMRGSDIGDMGMAFAAMKMAFQPARAGAIDKTIQWNFSGNLSGVWHARVHDGNFEYAQGPAPHPHTTVDVDSAVWLQILVGELNPINAFMTAKIKIKGDIALMLEFQKWFLRPS